MRRQAQSQPLSRQPSRQSLEVSLIWHQFSEAASIKAQAVFVSAESKTGRFDILPGHANFIGVIYNALSVKTVVGRTNIYYFTRGIVEVSENSVKIFLQGKAD